MATKTKRAFFAGDQYVALWAAWAVDFAKVKTSPPFPWAEVAAQKPSEYVIADSKITLNAPGRWEAEQMAMRRLGTEQVHVIQVSG